MEHTRSAPKFSMAETIFGGLVCALIDLLAALADFFTFGIVGFFSQTLSWLVFSFWFTIKGATAVSSPVNQYLVPILVQAIPVVPTTLATFLVRVYIENNPEKFGILGTALAVGKMDVGKLKNIKNTRGTLAAAKEARAMYHAAREEVENEPSEVGKRIKTIGTNLEVSREEREKKLRYIPGGTNKGNVPGEAQTETGYRRAA